MNTMTQYKIEYGSSFPIKWESTKCFNADGTEAMCDCGKPITQIIQGEVFTLILCDECWEKLESNNEKYKEGYL